MLTGSLQEKRGIYQCVLNLKDENGKRRLKWISTGLPIKGNKRKAEKILQDLITKYSAFDFSSGNMNVKFSDYAQKWLESKKGKVEKSTWDGYYNTVMKHIVPYFSKLAINIKDVKPSHIDDYYNYKSRYGRCDNKGGLSECSLKAHKFVLKAIFSKAMSVSKIIQENPAENVKLSKFVEDKKKEEVFLNQEEARKMLKAFQGHPLEHLIFIALCYGLRRSEVLGLKWDAIDFTEGTLKIKHTVVSNRSIVYKDRTKSKASKATYILIPKAKEILKQVKAKQEENKKLFGNEYIKSDYVFTWQNGKLFRPDYVTKSFQKVLKKNNLTHMRLHDLRHSCASILHDEKWSLKQIQEWLRHADIKTTGNIYVHIQKSREAIGDESVNDIFSL